MAIVRSFADACAGGPVGAVLLAHLEGSQLGDPWLQDKTRQPTNQSIQQACDAVAQMSFGDLGAVCMLAAEMTDPWTTDNKTVLQHARRNVDALRPVAYAIEERFGPQLHRPPDLTDQRWYFGANGPAGMAPLFRYLDTVYSNGELSWGALRTCAELSTEMLELLRAEFPGPHTRWRLAVNRPARIYEIHRPEDWHRLCRRYPRHSDSLALWPLGDDGASGPLGGHIGPQWSLVAETYDAVHLSWAGLLTSEGCIVRSDGVVTMLRCWLMEQTLWLRDCFGDPQPIDEAVSTERRAQDRAWIRQYLGRVGQ